MNYSFIFSRILFALILQTALFLNTDAQVDTTAKKNMHPDAFYSEGVLLNKQLKGFSGIWYANQPSDDEFVYKYGGGLGTYTANHNPLAIYAPEVNCTFFCFGGVDENGSLIHTVSCFDHSGNKLARPVGVIDKHTADAHDNPVISIDSMGYIWLFSTSHGVSRPSYIHRSKRPYDISEFQRAEAYKMEDGQKVPLDNFSYLQVYYQPGKGFTGLFTHYIQKDLTHGRKTLRVIAWMTSPDGILWSEWNDIAAIEEGHYQTSAYFNGKIGTTFNYHPHLKDVPGLNFRTNLYYLQKPGFNNKWQTVDGKQIDLPLTDVENMALVADYASKGLNVYINDLAFDENGNPVILFVTSKGYEAGPQNCPHDWNVAYWNGHSWDISYVTTSDNNYDMGSLYTEESNAWRIVGPTEPGPQLYNTGGEMAMWKSTDKGKTWIKVKQLTVNSEYNHSYARKPMNVNPGFYSIWADGHGRQPSGSRLYFSNKKGDVFRMPVIMKKDWVRLKPMQ